MQYNRLACTIFVLVTACAVILPPLPVRTCSVMLLQSPILRYLKYIRSHFVLPPRPGLLRRPVSAYRMSTVGNAYRASGNQYEYKLKPYGSFYHIKVLVNKQVARFIDSYTVSDLLRSSM